MKRETLLGVAATAIAVSCGSDDSKKHGASTPVPEPTSEIETTLLSEDKQASDKVVLSFGANVQDVTYSCQVSTTYTTNNPQQGSWKNCPSQGYSVATPKDSKVTVRVKAVHKSGKEDQTPLQLEYNYQSPTTPVTPPEPAPKTPKAPPSPDKDKFGYPAPSKWQAMRLNSLTLASHWTFTVPQGMHILQYAGTMGFGGSIEALQIMQGQDPNYFGIYPGSFFTPGNGCSKFANQPVSIAAPSGQQFGYCAGRLANPNQIGRLFGFQYAPNHIELGSDINSPITKRMLVQVHESRGNQRSVLRSLCGSDANSAGYSEIFGRMPIMNDFWAHNYLTDKVRTCHVSLSGFNSGRYQVAGFVYNQRDYFRDNCRGRCTNGDGAIEVIYMEKSENGMTRYSDYFARDFQALIFATLGRENPYVPFR